MVKSVVHRYTAAEAHARIEAGTAPWVAIGEDFLDDWRRSVPADRLALAEDRPASASAQDAELHRWAALIAAIVDWLCWNEEPRIEPPSWVADPVYRLPKPWFLYSGWQLRAWQLATTPAPFKMRNIFGGDRITDRV